MLPRLGGDKKCLFNSRWKNTTDVYLSPEMHSQGFRVPSLLWFCLQCLSEFPDQVQLPFRLIYRPSNDQPPKSFRMVHEIFRNSTVEMRLDERSGQAREIDLSKLDPRLWAVVIQVFDHIPFALRTYTLALNDELLPVVQGIDSTDKFSLITILELPGCPGLTDDSISELRCLHTLAAFDASSTALSVRGVMSLARTLRVNDSEELIRKLRGPWGLRILRVKRCAKIDDAIYPILPSMFPLLSVIDLRGTKCTPPIVSNSDKLFSACKDRRLFSSDLASSLEVLQQTREDIQLFSASKQFQFVLRIKNLCHEDVARALADVERLHRSRQLERWSSNRGEENQRLNHGNDSLDYTPIPENCIWCDDSFQSRYDESAYMYDRWGEEEGNDQEGVDSDDDGFYGCEEEAEWEGLGEDDDVEEHANSSFGLNVPNGFANVEQRLLIGPPKERIDFLGGTNQWSQTPPNSLPFQMQHTRLSVKDITDEDDLTSASGSRGCQIQVERSRLSPGLPVDVARSHKLYWYDADRHRAGTYVPLSLTMGGYNERLMLYRPVRPWTWLEEERTMLLEKEVQWKSAKANGTIPAIASVGKKKLKIQEGLQSMTALALHRRQVNNTRTRVERPRIVSRNPFTVKEKSSLLPESRTHAEIRSGFNAQKDARTISIHKRPEPTKKSLWRNPLTGPITQASSAQEQGAIATSVSRKAQNSAATASPFTLSTPAVTSNPGCGGTTSTKREEDHSKQRNMQFTEPLSVPSSSTSLNSSRLKISKSRRKDENSNQNRSFSWAEWASRKQ